MIQWLWIFMIPFSMQVLTLVDFNEQSAIDNWYIVDDVVMGGRSAGSFSLSPEGHGIFTGEVSLENNGGFSSVRHRFSPIELQGYTRCVIRLKGDGKRYQFRIKANTRDYYSFISHFSTDGTWQTVEIPLHEMYPSFRGRKLDMPNYSGERMEEIALLIANKKAESFRLVIDKIEFR